VLRAVTLPVRRTAWSIDQGGASDEVAQFVADNLGLPCPARPVEAGRTRDRFSWAEHLAQALLMIVYGHMFFEQVYRIGDDGRAYLRKLAPRLPTRSAQINVAPDGGLEVDRAVRHHRQRRDGGEDPRRAAGRLHPRPEGGNWLGQSLLRPGVQALADQGPAAAGAGADDRAQRHGRADLHGHRPGHDGEDFEAGKKLATEFRSGDSAGGAIPNGASSS
jgi:hypothetical protein